MCDQKKMQESMAKIETINQIQGFEPSQFAIKLADLSEDGEERMRLPVMTQLAWFRLKFPMGKISVEVAPSGEVFVATAKVYADYKDADNCFLAEATASRGKCEQKPSVSPREWAQTAAILLFTFALYNNEKIKARNEAAIFKNVIENNKNVIVKT